LTPLDRLNPRTIVLADKAYHAGSIRDLIESRGAVPNIPAKSIRKWKPCFSRSLYRERNRAERFFNNSSTSAASQPATTSSLTTSSATSTLPPPSCDGYDSRP